MNKYVYQEGGFDISIQFIVREAYEGTRPLADVFSDMIYTELTRKKETTGDTLDNAEGKRYNDNNDNPLSCAVPKRRKYGTASI